MFLSAAIAHLLAVMSPGPDTAIIFQQSFGKGRSAGILTALGIGFGIFLPVRSLIVVDASAPEILIIATPETPGPVDNAKIVIKMIITFIF